MDTDQINSDLRALRVALDTPDLEPDPDRRDWSAQQSALRALCCLAEGLLPALADAAAEAPTQRSALSALGARLCGEIGALLHAAGDGGGARAYLERAQRLEPDEPLRAAAARDPATHTAIVHGLWLRRALRERAARARFRGVARGSSVGALRDEAARLEEGAWPLRGAPALLRINGCGVGLYGARDRDAEGSYVATWCLSLLFVPVLPLAAYRVMDQGGGKYVFLAGERLSPLLRGIRRAITLAVLAALLGGGAWSYLSSPGYALSRACAAAAARERAGDRAGALAAYAALIGEYQDRVDGAALQPVAERIAALAIAQVVEPLTVARRDAGERVALRVLALPAAARAGAASDLVLAALDRWAAQIGQGSIDAAQASLALGELAVALADGDRRDLAFARRSALHRRIAGSLAAEWPLLALRHLMAIPADDAALDQAGVILAGLGDEDSLLVDARPEVEEWVRRASRQRGRADAARALGERLERALGDAAEPTRQKAIDGGDGGDGAALTVLAARRPRDQELVVALADVDRAAGRIDAAIARLTGLGPPGRIIAGAALRLGVVLAQANHLEEADARLTAFVGARLPFFHAAVQAYEEKARLRQASLVDRLKSGQVPPELESRVAKASPEARGTIVGEWLATTLASDQELVPLRAAYVRDSGVVPAALALGNVKLQRASAASGPLRQGLLDEAERVFVAIGRQAEGRLEYHLALGAVHHRLGRDAAGDADLATAERLGGLEGKLAVAEVYRELGLLGAARERARAVFDAGPPLKSRAAYLLYTLSATPEEREQWIARCDATSAQVQRAQRQARADRLIRDQQFAEADRLIAQNVTEYARSAGADPAATNNLALALEARYLCTGDPSHLADAVRRLEAAQRLVPDNSIVTHNLAAVLAMQGQVRVLGRFLPAADLHLDASEADALLDALLSGERAAEVRAALRADAAVRRAIDLSRQYEVLSPASPAGYRQESDLTAQLDDSDAATALHARLSRVAAISSGEAERQWRRFVDASNDAAMTAALDGAVKSADALLARVAGRARAPASLAAALLLSARAHLQRGAALINRADVAASIAALRRASAAWRPIGTRRWLTGALALDAIFGAASRSEANRAVLLDGFRTTRPELLLHHATQPGQAALRAALRAEPSLMEAVAVAHQAPADQLGLAEWAIARVAGDALLETSANASLDRPGRGAWSEIAALLDPYDPATAERARLARARPRP